MRPPDISIVIPVLNESAIIAGLLASLQPLRARGAEVIIVDGGSRDATLALAAPLVDHAIAAPRGRARQMNAGAGIARGDVLLFLHADSRLPEDSDTQLRALAANAKHDWGRFDIRLSGQHPLLRVVEFAMNWRSRSTGIATGDQAIFVRRRMFEAVGGFPEIDLMEDIALSARLKRISKPLCLRQRVHSSSRRWERDGVLRSVFLMWRLRLLYFLGVDPGRLSRIYYRHGN